MNLPVPGAVGPPGTIVLPDKDVLERKYREKSTADRTNHSGGGMGGRRCFSMSGDSRLGFA